MRTVFLLQAVFLVETVNTSTGVNKLLLAGVERVTLGANFNLDVLFGRTSLNNCTTRASDSSLFVLGMDTFLHEFHLSHQISVKRQTALPLVQTLEYNSICKRVLQVLFLFCLQRRRICEPSCAAQKRAQSFRAASAPSRNCHVRWTEEMDIFSRVVWISTRSGPKETQSSPGS